jgi:hypothetical protein
MRKVFYKVNYILIIALSLLIFSSFVSAQDVMDNYIKFAQGDGLIFTILTITQFLRVNIPILNKLQGWAVIILAMSIGLLVSYVFPLIPENTLGFIITIAIAAANAGGGYDILHSIGKSVGEGSEKYRAEHEEQLLREELKNPVVAKQQIVVK